MSYELHSIEAPVAADREAIAAPLWAYNLSKVATIEIKPLAIALRDAGGTPSAAFGARLHSTGCTSTCSPYPNPCVARTWALR